MRIIQGLNPNQEKHDQHGPDIKQRLEPFGVRHPWPDPRRTGVHPHVDRDRDHIASRRHDARYEGRKEQFCDVLLGQDRVNHKHHRGRNENAERAARSKCRCRKPAGVSVFAQLWQGHTAHRGGCRKRRAADRAEPGAGPDRGHGNPAFAMAQKALCRLEQGLAHPAQRCEMAHEQEHRNNRQRVIRERCVGFRFQPRKRQARVPGHDHKPDEPPQKHRQTNRHAQEDQRQQGRK